MRRALPVLLVCLFLLSFAVAKDKNILIPWPEGNPIVEFTVVQFRDLGGYDGRKTYVIDLTAKNISDKRIPAVSPRFMLFDKNDVRIGEGYIHLSNVAPGEKVKFQVNVGVTGNPVRITLSSEARKVLLTVYSVPSGAAMKVDGVPQGVTPQALNLTQGAHTLEFAKEGYNVGKFPLVVTPEQLSGGTITFELGGTAHDTVELRDGTVVTGDVEQVIGMDVVVRVGGNVQKFNRNQVKKILLVEREPQ